MIFEDDIEKIEMSQNIKNVLLKEIIKENERN